MSFQTESVGAAPIPKRKPNRKRAICHPDRPRDAHGLCSQCYHKKLKQDPNYRAKRLVYEKRYKEANKEKVKAWAKARSKKHESKRMFRKYGIDYDQYCHLVIIQGGVCAICKRDNGKHKLLIDHCHKTGKVRGLLCKKCNTGIGLLGDCAALISRAVEYCKNVEASCQS